jgi:murein L,D-transpeptidase YafK
MIHGSCASIGCYAMTNPSIEEIYTLTYMALSAGQKKIDLAIFPFRMDDEHLKKFSTSPYYAFWKTLKPGYELFEKKHTPPNVGINKMAYKFN